MKTTIRKNFILALFFCFPLTPCIAQQDSSACEGRLKITYDKFTKEKMVSGGMTIPTTPPSTRAIRIITMLTGGTMLLNLEGIGISCVDRGDKVFFLFEDDTRFTMQSAAKFNCQGDFTIYFGSPWGNISALDHLSTKPLKSIRLQTASKVIDVDLSQKDATDLFTQLKCLRSYVKY